MRVAVFSTKPYDRQYLSAANAHFGHDLVFLEPKLDLTTAPLAAGFPAVCVFVNDQLDRPLLTELAANGTRLVALRCAGFNNVDLHAAADLDMVVVRVPAYSPHAVAEFTVALLLALDRRIPRAWTRVRDGNFALDGLVGNGLFGKTVGIVGTGRIGALVATSLKLGFGCRVLAFDHWQDPPLIEKGIEYVPLDELMTSADIISLHCPLTPDTHHLVNQATIDRAKPGFILVNTSRGALIDAEALVEGLKNGRVGGVALDVYEQEADLFFEDLSNEIIQDDVFQRLLTFPNVLVTGHQAFLTSGALAAIAETTMRNIAASEAGHVPENIVVAEAVSAPKSSS